MRMLFVLLIGTLAANDIFKAGMSLGPGLSVKNALLYPIALGLLFRMALTGRFRMRLPIVNMAFILWVTYAILTWVVCVTVIHYPGYAPLQMAISLKSVLVDSVLFFFIYFYGVESEQDFFLFTKTLAFFIGLANILTLADVAGLVHLGITIGSAGVEAGRVFGAFGNANDSGAVIVTLLPMIVAVATLSRGPARIYWYASAIASLAVLVLGVSRSAYVGLAIGYAAAVFLCRRWLPASKVVAWTLIGVTCFVIAAGVAAVLMPGIAQVFVQRLFNQSMASSISVASSGRTTIWMDAISTMMAHPITLLTGFGWNVYHTMFVLVTHNYYLDQWFGLGLIGLFSFLTIQYQTVATGLRAIVLAAGPLRPYMIALVFGMLGLAVCLVFGNLDQPWCYVWVYVGLTLRMAADIIEKAQKGVAAGAVQTAGRAPAAPGPARLPGLPARTPHRIRTLRSQ
ncbi:MAG: O-antigen ligase family protein [Proteobacteria bacterium]|nr:O-antigen ligase family protein [Pseudomonadota bacterium]